MRTAADSPWAWDAHLLHELVTAHLGRFLGAIDAGRPVLRLPRPPWWGGASLPDQARALHGLDALDSQLCCLAVQATPAASHLLVLDLARGGWREPALDRWGAHLIGLAALRWGVSETKAAWKWARACGYPTPRPA